MNIIRHWNGVSLQLVADDHTNATPATPPPANQGGPTRTSRALAMIHLAMHDVIGAITTQYPTYLKTLNPVPTPISLEAAVSVAARDTALLLYPSHATAIAQAFTGAMASFPRNGQDVQNGLLFGAHVADELRKNRLNDGSDVTEPYQFKPEAGKHHPDPHSPGQGVLGPEWGDVKPFTYAKASDAPLAAPPGLTSPKYAEAFKQVKEFGRDDLPQREPDLAVAGIFWGYDGSRNLGTPPRLYNQIVLEISKTRNPTVVNDARLLALVNVGMADAGISCWHWKYVYDFWRPVVGIREANKGSGQTGSGDGNRHTKGDPFWCPLGAPDTNGFRTQRFLPPNFTPGFPAYPSGHSTFGATCFLLTARFYGCKPEEIEFDFVSDEFNGANRDAKGDVRTRLSRHFTLASAIDENSDSRIWLGVHWSFDASGGQDLGKKVTDLVYTGLGKPKFEKGPKGAAPPVAGQPAPAPSPAIRTPHR